MKSSHSGTPIFPPAVVEAGGIVVAGELVVVAGLFVLAAALWLLELFADWLHPIRTSANRTNNMREISFNIWCSYMVRQGDCLNELKGLKKHW